MMLAFYFRAADYMMMGLARMQIDRFQLRAANALFMKKERINTTVLAIMRMATLH